MAAPERSGFTVLVADDDALVRTVLRMALDSVGHVVIEARDFDSVIGAVRDAENIHLLVLDLNMPGGTVSETLATVRGERPALPVLILSGSAQLPESLSDQCVEFARKPVDLDDFLSRVSHLLSPPPVASASPGSTRALL